jgi:hypothetical protein
VSLGMVRSQTLYPTELRARHNTATLWHVIIAKLPPAGNGTWDSV